MKIHNLTIRDCINIYGVCELYYKFQVSAIERRIKYISNIDSYIRVHTICKYLYPIC